MKKSEAMDIVRSTYQIELENANTHFSKVNKSKPVFWFENPVKKIHEHQFINLLTEDEGDVSLLEVPCKFMRDNFDGFRIREEKQVVCLELDISTYQNVIGSGQAHFRKFLKSDATGNEV